MFLSGQTVPERADPALIKSGIPERKTMGSDGTYTIWFGLKPPKGKESNWIKTMPGKSDKVISRLYESLEL